MSVAKTGALPNAYRMFTIEINSFAQKQMEGLVIHESRTGAAPFHNLLQMVHILNEVFDQIHYPMRTLDPRYFNRKHSQPLAAPAAEFAEPAGAGSLATFRLCVKYRYHATWQGNITWVEGGATYPFESFLQLMKVFDGVLGQGARMAVPAGKQMCEVAVHNYRRCLLSGEVSHPAVEERRTFANEFELMESMEDMFAPIAQTEDEMVIVPRRPGSGYGALGSVTFVVRILFHGNATWQGTIRWKEQGEQESFRSFLEMLMMMDQAARRSISREEGVTGSAAETA